RARGFKSHREFFMAILKKATGEKLEGDAGEKLASLAYDMGEGAGFMLPAAFAPKQFTAGSDEHGIYDDTRGGMLVPTQVLPGIRETMWEGDPTAGRTTQIPMTSPTVEFIARVDKNHSTSVSGGF